jgi:hypothetical protein
MTTMIRLGLSGSLTRCAFDVFVFQRIILVVVTTAFDDGARSAGTEENEKGMLETLSLDRIVISTDYLVIV